MLLLNWRQSLKIVLTKEAKDSLREIESYIGQTSKRAAQQTIITILNKITRQLPAHPQSAKPGILTDTRELYFSDVPYCVIYTSDNKTITVLSIFHTAQSR
ncbi:type II toxin-antitoxin system RelE/ParE family toxin [Pelodictyon phaeoclathratiforme]|jgi:addiction module RelE/StbE family toxin|uniref:type II toxin-antitoxin system RelE/ParE family toxin n=1 Tax=Pelodictyon phaeoclathratiforme TaxID=34090 RepID=UPI000A00F885